MFYDATRNDHGFEYDPFKALVAPRPIGWISSLSASGIANLAPYSYFNAMSQDPHYVAFGTGPRKDSINNIEAVGEFAVNLATWDLREQMNLTSAHVGSHVDEFELARLAKAPCRMIKAPRVAGSPVCLECKLFRVIECESGSVHAGRRLVAGIGRGARIAPPDLIREGAEGDAASPPTVANASESAVPFL